MAHSFVLTVLFAIGCADIASIKVQAYKHHIYDEEGPWNEKIAEDCSACGIRRPMEIAARVPGGEPIPSSKMYPWMVRIAEHSRQNSCGGAILNQFYILTAAHCVLDVQGPRYHHKVFFQTSSPKKMSRGYAIDKIIVHPKYSLVLSESTGVTIAKYDIALVKLKEAIKCDEYQNAICLPSAHCRLPTGTKSIIAGWGRKDVKQKLLAEVLQFARMIHLNYEECIKAVPETEMIKHYMICGGGTQATICYGDSGSPLMHQIGNKFYAFGVASSETNTSCSPTSPFLYTEVAKFVDWIKEQQT